MDNNEFQPQNQQPDSSQPNQTYNPQNQQQDFNQPNQTYNQQNQQYNFGQPNQMYSQPNQPYNGQQNPYSQSNNVELEPPMTLGEWIITIIVLGIPCVNIIMLFVWGFGQGNTSRKNFCRASLIMAAIGVVVFIIFSSAFAALIASVVSESGYGYY